MTETKAISQVQVDTRYQALVGLIKGKGGEAQARIAAHIRAVASAKGLSNMNLAQYHVSSAIPMEEKYEAYALISSALGLTRDASGKPTFGKPDWSRLQGQLGAGAKKAEAEEVKRADPLDTPKKEATSESQPPRTISPVVPKITPATLEVKSTPTDPTRDDLATMLARAIEGKLNIKQQPAPDLDDGKVRLICQEELVKLDLDEQIKKANSNGAFPVDRVQKLIDDALSKMVHRVELVMPNGECKAIKGVAHKSMPALLKMCAARSINILLVGPTGSGKTTAAEQVAQALDLPFYFNGAIDNEYKLKGFIDAGGKIVSPAFRHAFEKGGVYLFDEVDASLPSAVLAFNAALSNHICDFPDKMVDRHKDCIILAAGNTWLGGATFDYVGRMKQDMAFADRFATLYWDIDEKMETALATNKEWCEYVQKVRANVVRHGLKVIVSPRATLSGQVLLAAGVDREQVIASCVRKGMSQDQWNQVSVV